MKSLFFSLVFVLLGFFTYAQEASVQSAEDLKKSVVDGKITMTLPAEITKETKTRPPLTFTRSLFPPSTTGISKRDKNEHGARR